MKYQKIMLHIGLQRPLKLLHLSDTHICLADERDNERKRQLAFSRAKEFGESLHIFNEAVEYGRKNCDLFVHTGDLIDFISYPNLEILQKYLSGTDSFFAVGNHEFSQYVGEAWEDEAYKKQSFDRVQQCVANSIDFASRIINGLNLVAIDNSYYLFAERHLKMLRQEVAKGLPILLLVHNPLYTDELYCEMMENQKRECAYLVGVPKSKLICYPEERFRQQMPDTPTERFVEYVRHEPAIKAILAGHLHFNYISYLNVHLIQYITGGTFNHHATEFEIF